LIEIDIGNYGFIFNDINLSPAVIEMFVNIEEFRIHISLLPIDGVKGFLHMLELREEKLRN
jgi:hypothetical protein